MNMPLAVDASALHAAGLGVRWREANTQDEGFLRSLFADVRRADFAWCGWDELRIAAMLKLQYEAQHRAYRLQWPQARLCVIEWGGASCWVPVGRLWYASEALAVHLLDISLLTSCQGHGVGTACVRELQSLAGQAALPIHLHVASNGRARGLYERLGFNGNIDLSAMHQFMCWRDPGADGISQEDR